MEESKKEKNPKKMKQTKKKCKRKPHVMANACDQHLRDRGRKNTTSLRHVWFQSDFEAHLGHRVRPGFVLENINKSI